MSNVKSPKIRFKGFTDDWEQRKFGDTVVIERGGSPRPIDKFITDDEKGLNNQKDFQKLERFIQEILSYPIL